MKERVERGSTEERKRKKTRQEGSMSKRESTKLGTVNREREGDREKKREASKKKEKISEPR